MWREGMGGDIPGTWTPKKIQPDIPQNNNITGMFQKYILVNGSEMVTKRVKKNEW